MSLTVDTKHVVTSFVPLLHMTLHQGLRANLHDSYWQPCLLTRITASMREICTPILPLVEPNVPGWDLNLRNLPSGSTATHNNITIY
ncbi:hypothetical protein FKM82_021161 [Ascaphus truei]